VILVCLLGPAIALGLAVGIAATDDVVKSPYHPATLLPSVAGHVRDASIAASELLRDLFDGFTAAFRERIRHEASMPPPGP
jgi:hypothetical protein